MSRKATILGCAIDRLDMEGTLRRCEEIVEARQGVQHMAVNVAKIVTLRDNPRLREIVAASELVNADGQPLVWASRLLGDPLPERVAGIDLMHRLFELAERKGYRVYVLGAREHVLERALDVLRTRHPRLEVAGSHHGYFSDADSGRIAGLVRDARPDILFVAMSSPRKEYWLAEHRDELGVPLMMGVGGAIDILAGDVRRAPEWMQRTGLEWFFRLAQEPRRMWRRYLVTNTRFALLLARELATGRGRLGR